MSSVQSFTAQRPLRMSKFVVNAITAAYAFPAASVEAFDSVVVYSTLAAATPAVATAGTVLTNGALFNSMAGITPAALVVGQELLDMGRYVKVYIGGVHAYTLARVQLKSETAGVTEGISGLTYNTFYIVTETNLGATAPGASGVGVVSVARV